MKLFKSFINTGKTALGIGQLKKDSRYFLDIGKRFYTETRALKDAPAGADATQHANSAPMSPEVRATTLHHLRLWLKVHALLCVLCLIYLVVKVCEQDWHSIPIVFALMLLEGAQVFRHHFNYYRLKHNRLRATVKDWRQDLFKCRRTS